MSKLPENNTHLGRETPSAPPEKLGFWAEVRQIYIASRKPHDIFWNTWVARPLAALLVYGLKRTSVTPNQVTFLGAVAFLGCAAALIGLQGWSGMLIAAAILQFSYLLDCADGQLARIKSMTSEVGAYLDFLIDEIKALLLVGAFALRLWLIEDNALWLVVGLAGMALVSIATSLTNFVRRPEYAGRDIKPGESARRKEYIPAEPIPRAIWAVQSVAAWLVHYPSWFVYLALADGLPAFNGSRWFIYLFLGVYYLYTAKTGLGVVLKLGRASFYKD